MAKRDWIGQIDIIKPQLKEIAEICRDNDDRDWLIKAATAGGISMQAQNGHDLILSVWANEQNRIAKKKIRMCRQSSIGEDFEIVDDEKDDDKESMDKFIEEEEEEKIASPSCSFLSFIKCKLIKDANDGGCCLTSFDLWQSFIPGNKFFHRNDFSISDTASHEAIFFHMTDLLSNECSVNSQNIIKKLQSNDKNISCLSSLYNDDAVGAWFIDPLSNENEHREFVRVLYKLPPEDGDDEILWITGSLNTPGVINNTLTAEKFPSWTISEWDLKDLQSAYEITSAALAVGSFPPTHLLPRLFSTMLPTNSSCVKSREKEVFLPPPQVLSAVPPPLS
mmetsp:Transcript_13795/g.18425  ORF Transcript_13795/g.18425 Transcript_13795/m.18425 type:complete len:336 (-) Transcript_13795:49-1056(-)